MGKVRAKTLGDQEQEQKERESAEKRRLAKIEAAKAEGRVKKVKVENVKGKEMKEEPPVIANQVKQSSSEEEIATSQAYHKGTSFAEASPNNETSASSVQAKVEKPKAKKQFSKKDARSANWKKAAALIEKGKTYSLSAGLELLDKTHLAKFDETVELHINTIGHVNGSMTLPHGTGKSTRVAVLAPSKDAAAAEALLKEIESGKITFDVLVATPDAMPRLAKVARILGPKGLMPNPKNGTVTVNPETVAKQYAGGHMTFKTESKAPVLHLSVGKLSFGKEKLEANIKAALRAVEHKNVRKVILKSTMSPAIRLTV